MYVQYVSLNVNINILNKNLIKSLPVAKAIFCHNKNLSLDSAKRSKETKNK